MTKLIIFDWDGTLADSSDRIVAAVQGAFVDMALTPPCAEDARSIIGLGLPEALLRLLPGADKEHQDRFASYYRSRFSANMAPVALFPAVGETVAGLVERGFRLAIATGKGRRGITRELESSRLASFFTTVRCAEDGPSKPHPKMLLDLLSELMCPPDQAIMVGDTVFDAEMAERAQVPYVAVSYGVHEVARLLEFEPLTLLNSIAELPPFLARHRATE